MSENGQFRIEVVDGDESPHLALIGELDLAVSEGAWDELKPLVEPGASLILDLSRVTFIDSRGLNVLVKAINVLDGGTLVLRGASPGVLRLIEISGLQAFVTLA